MCEKMKMASVRVTDLYQWLKIVTLIKSTSELHLQSGTKEYTGPRWIFRGQANAEWKIESSFERDVLKLYGNVDGAFEETFRAKERLSIEYYRQWAKGGIDSSASNGEVLALMRHNGVPTRLVDFTEVPLVALYFALEDTSQKGDFAVWASVADTNRNSFVAKIKRNLRPGVLLKTKGVSAYKKPSLELDYDIVSLLRWDDSERESFERLLTESETPPDVPVLKYVPRILNQRQRSQRGLFLASTRLVEPFMSSYLNWLEIRQDALETNDEIACSDMLLDEKRFKDECAEIRLLKFVFDADLRRSAEEFLGICNLNKQSLYDDLQGTTKYVTDMLKSKPKLQV